MPAQRAPEFEPGAADGGDGPRPVPAAAVSPGLGSDVPVARGRPTRRPWQRVPYFWFILPALLAYGILFVFPTLRAFYVSLFDWSGVGPVGDLIWFDNFADLLRSDRF